MKRYSPDLQFGGSGDCPAAYMEEADSGDYVEYQSWMDEAEKMRLDAERYRQVREYYWFQREVAHRFGVTEPHSVNDLDAALDRARGVK